MWQGGDINTSVYWADATDSADRIEVDVEKAAQRPVNEYLTRNFATVVYDRNTHRLTHGKLTKNHLGGRQIDRQCCAFTTLPTYPPSPTLPCSGMVERKVQNWKSLCADIFKSINDFVNDPTQEVGRGLGLGRSTDTTTFFLTHLCPSLCLCIADRHEERTNGQ